MELRECPFCGKPPRYLEHMAGFYSERVICDTCGFYIDIEIDDPKNWNRRADDAIRAERDAIAAELATAKGLLVDGRYLELFEENQSLAVTVEKIFTHMQERVDIERSKADSTTSFSMKQVASTHADTVELMLRECRVIPNNAADILKRRDAEVLRRAANWFVSEVPIPEAATELRRMADEKEKP